MSSNTGEIKFLYPVNSITSLDPLFAEATGSAQFFSYSQNSTEEGSSSALLDVLVNGGVAQAIAEADATFINDPAFTNLFTENTATGEDGAFQASSTSETQVVAQFNVAAGQVFSFEFTASLDLLAKEIENPDTEYSTASSKTTFMVLDISNGDDNPILIDYFGLTGDLISSEGTGEFQSSSSGNVSFTSFGETDIDGDNGIDSVTALAIFGTYERTFSYDTQLVIVQTNTSLVELRGDTLINNLGDDVIYGTIWDDYIEGTHYNDKIYASLGHDTVKGYDGDDIIEGGAGNDWLYGGNGRDSIHGGSGDDYIDGGYGLDYIDGGSGYDTVSYAARSNDVYLDLAQGIVSFATYWSNNNDDDDDDDDDNYISSNTQDTETIHNIEKVIGSQGNDTIYGDDGDNHLEGYHGRDYINGRGGNDYIDGGYGYDTIDGGDGYDTVSYAARHNDLHLNLEKGVVTFSGFSGKEKIYNIEKAIGSTGNDTLEGDKHDNHLDGYHGNDDIEGGLGKDYIEGGKGHDTILGDGYYWGVSGNDTIDGGKGHDWIKAGGGSDTVKGGYDNDIIYGDYVYEGSHYDGNDYLIGGAGHDTIIGGGGEDRIIGSDSYAVGAHEKDVLIGGSDADIFVLGNSHQAYYIADGKYDFAEVKDFTIGEDILELHGSVGEYHVGISSGDAYISHSTNGKNDLVAIVYDVYSGFDLNHNANFV
ncbi:calcium-binding protein [Calothrix rhizosoleniae]|uniref:calcium-binding protein n=1 Tax=Calothrix rhizosoleniae TaxID=888997 RepID=UPI000B4A1F6A|nr:calcium-binding protein [Calothrix rhizosoleniae]